MGCITSSQKDGANAADGETRALSLGMKTRFASVDGKVVGPFKEEAMAKLVFVYGRTSQMFLITTPALHPASSERRPHQGVGEENDAAAEVAVGEANGEEEVPPPSSEVRWCLFNDSKSDAKVEATFFHAKAVRPTSDGGAGSGEEGSGIPSAVIFERFDDERVKATASVPAGSTVPFVEGAIKGYMWKCLFMDTKTGAYENATAAE